MLQTIGFEIDCCAGFLIQYKDIVQNRFIRVLVLQGRSDAERLCKGYGREVVLMACRGIQKAGTTVLGMCRLTPPNP